MPEEKKAAAGQLARFREVLTFAPPESIGSGSQHHGRPFEYRPQ